MAKEGIELEIYPYNGITGTTKYIIPGRRNPQVLEEVGGNGGGSFWVSKSDPKYVANNTILDSRNLCKVKVNGTIVGGFLLGERESTIVGTGEKAEEGFQLTGLGLKTWFDDAEVVPYGGLKPESSKNRYFNFATEQGTWYNSSEWITPFVAGDVLSTNPSFYHNAPAKWPEISRGAKWIWGSAFNAASMPFEPCWFRWEVNIAVAGLYAIYVAVDDEFTVYVDGAELAKSSENTTSWRETARVEIALSTGAHVIAFKGKNRDAPGYLGPAALVASLTRVLFDGEEALIGNSGDAGWKVLPHTTNVPGWSIGEVLLKLLAEAQARGILFPTYLTPTFTAAVDSYGVAWAAKMEWIFGVGESYLSVLSKIEELYDVWIDVSNMTLNMAPIRGVTHDKNDAVPISLMPGQHLRSAKTTSKGKIKNTMIMDTADGWVEAQDAASVAKYGRIEGSLKTEAGKTFSTQLANLVFAQRADEEEGATYDLIITDKIPYVHFKPGDWLLAPNEKSLQVLRRVMSIAIEEGPSGDPKYTIEFDTIFASNEERFAKILSKVGGAGVGGGLSNAGGISSGGSGGITLPPTNTPILLYPKPPTNVVVTSAGYWNASGTNALSKITVDWDPVTQNTDDTATVPQWYVVYGKLTTSANTGFEEMGRTSATVLDIYDKVPGSAWQFYVVAINPDGQVSAASPTISHTALGPTTSMAAPTTPTTQSEQGLFIINWDGLMGGVAPPPQFRYLYAEVKPASSGSFTRMGPTLSRDGRQIVIPGLTKGTAYIARLTGVDGAGVLSTVSGSSSNTTIMGVDIGDLNTDVTDAISAAAAAGKKAGEQINLFADSGFEANTSEFWTMLGATTNVTTAPNRGTRHIRVAAAGAERDVLHYNTIFEGDPGDAFYMRAFVSAANAAAASVTDSIELSIMYGSTPALGSTVVLGLSGTLQLDIYSSIAGSWVIPQGIKYFQPRLVLRNTGSTGLWHIDDVRLFRMTNRDDIVNGSIVTDKLAADSVTAVKIQAAAIDATKIQASAVTTEKLAAGAITASKLAAEAVEASSIKAGTIQVSHVSPSFGSNLNLAANESIVLVAGQAAAAETTAEDTQDNLNVMQTYYTFGPTGAIVSMPGSVFATAVRNDKIEMLENGNVISYWNSGVLYVNQFVGAKVTLGNHQFEQYGDGTVMRAL